MPHKILSIGEVLWDLLPTGPVLGGAPSNFAVHAHALGGDSRLVSRVGNDDYGREILRQMRERGMDTSLISTDESRPTGTVSVTLASDGQPHYIIHENVAWDAIPLSASAQQAAREADAICYGTLVQRQPISQQTTLALVNASSPKALRIFDINLRQSFYSREIIERSLGLANVLKLNETELPVLREMFALTGEMQAQMEQLIRRFALRGVAFTRGAQGSCLLIDDQFSDHPGTRAQVKDTIGAGDAFTAALVLGMLAGSPLKQIHNRASEVAAYVCSHTGPTPPLPARFRMN